MSGSLPMPNVSFSLLTPSTVRFGPRLGNVVLRRNEQAPIQIQTPNLLTSTSRGVIPHLSRDHYGFSAIRWVNLPFESFLDVSPPIPTLVPSKHPWHTLTGFSLGQHMLAMSLRDPADGREMPPNGNTQVSAYSLRGVRKVSLAQWKDYVYACKPDIAFALADTPFTHPPYSQKRLTKSIERSAAWLAHILAPSANDGYRPGILVHMAGASNASARRVFAESLVETLHGPEAEAVKPLQTLDQGVLGYSFDLTPIRLSLDAAEKKHPESDSLAGTVPTIPGTQNSAPVPLDKLELDPVLPSHTDLLPPLFHASLEPLPTTKLRLVNTVQNPHEILLLISSVGIDLFDAHWAQRAADIGVALDFTFPAPSSRTHSPSAPKTRGNGKYDLGHNLYDPSYSHDFSGFSSSTIESCTCPACMPVAPHMRITHGVDDPSYTGETLSIEPRTKSSFTRAYVHHLLHTHEMSAHSLLVLHNLATLDSFFRGIRDVLGKQSSLVWDEEVKRFGEVYDEGLSVFGEARKMWRDVDLARGKGRLAREKAKQEESALGTAVEL